MKTHLKLFLLSVVLGLMPLNRMAAQIFTTLHSFPEMPPPSFITNSDGAYPAGELVLSSNVMYGTTYEGGHFGKGAIFSVKTDGTDLKNLHSFTELFPPFYSTNADGVQPRSGLLLSNDVLYGTTTGGGTVFKLRTDGSGFTVLHSFAEAASFPPTNSAGANPEARLVLAGSTLYGTTQFGGNSGRGTIFKINTNGTGFANLRVFGIEGDGPKSGLILLGNTLFGTAKFGGSFGNGSVFKINTNGKGFATLYSFNLLDGAFPGGELVSAGTKVFGTANIGGSPIGGAGNGVVYVIHTNGTGFTVLHRFPEFAGSSTNSDGAMPRGELVLSGDTLYGVTGYGGRSGNGAIFAVRTNGSGFTNLYDFTALSGSSPDTNSDGALPEAGLVLSGDTLYGAASGGGTSQNGTLFSLSFAPQLTINRSAAAAAILKWPTNVAGFDYGSYDLQFTTNLASQASWTAISPAPVVVNGQNTVTNPISAAQTFYRLAR